MSYLNFVARLIMIVSVYTFSSCVLADSNLTDQADSLLEKWDTDCSPGLAVAISHNNKVIYSAGLGLSDLESKTPITPNTVFHAASISKQVTAFSILLLASEDKLSLSDDIRTHLPELTDQGVIVTINDLLNHTSGLREVFTLTSLAGWLTDDIRTNNQLMKMISRQTAVNFLPQAKIEYSNTGYFLLAQAVAKVSGQSFAEFTQERIFTPLGMDQTQFLKSRNQIVADQAKSYAPAKDNAFRKNHYISEMIGSTGLKTTVLDLSKWANNFVTQKVGNSKVFTQMAKRMTAANGDDSVFARGQQVRQHNGFSVWSHGGTDAGYRAFFLRVPEVNFSVSVLSNRADMDPSKVAFDLLDLYLAKHEKFFKPVPKEWQKANEKELSAYSGDYELFSGLIFRIFHKENTLYFSRLNTQSQSPLTQISEHQFLLDPTRNMSVRFVFDENNNVSHFDLVFSEDGFIKVEKIELSPYKEDKLEEYQGEFYSPELLTQFSVEIVDEQLKMSHLRLPSIGLVQYEKDTFSTFFDNFTKIQFVRDYQGRVTGFKLSGPLANDVLFSRR